MAKLVLRLARGSDHGSVGYFTTVWFWVQKGKPDPRLPANAMGEGEWKWVTRHGDALTTARPTPEIIETKIASCKGRANAPINAPDEGVQMKTMFSRDQSLNWEWQYAPRQKPHGNRAPMEWQRL